MVHGIATQYSNAREIDCIHLPHTNHLSQWTRIILRTSINRICWCSDRGFSLGYSPTIFTQPRVLLGSVNAPMVRTLTVRPDHLCCHKWSGRTTCACITGPPGPIMLEHKWSGLNINGPVLHVLLWV